MVEFKHRLIVFLVLTVVLIFALGCGGPGKKKIKIFYAASLAVPLREISKEYTALHPEIEIVSESSGSQMACRKVSELNRAADILLLADYLLIPELLVPEYADWNIIFTGNEMVIAFDEKSKYGNEINADNWYEILLREDVNFGYTDPNLEPAGYRTVMMFRLADIYYNRNRELKGKKISEALLEKCPRKHIRPSVTELEPLLASMELDYIVFYRSVAEQHRLKYVRLPAEINLGSREKANYYRQVSAVVQGAKKGEIIEIKGMPIFYGLTIPKVAENRDLAIDFLKFMLSEQGREIFRRNYHIPIYPALASDKSKIPKALWDLVE